MRNGDASPAAATGERADARAGDPTALLAAVIANAHACIAVVAGRELRYTLANPAYQAIAPGVPMIGRTYAEVFPAAAASGSLERFLRVLDTGEPWDVDAWVAPVPGKADATWRGRVTRLPVGPGEPPAALIVIEDVTAQRRAEEALRLSELRLRRMFELNPIGVVHGDDAGRILEANDAYLRIIGRSREDVAAGRVRWDGITPREHLARDAEAVAQARTRGVSDVYEKEYLRPDGARVPVLVACAAMGRAGELTAFVADITDRRRAEDALRESEERLRAGDRRKNEFLAMLSHELRNPLAPIRNALSILDRAEPDGPQARRAKEIAGRQLAYLGRLVDDLLDVTRIASGKVELRRAELDVAALARRTAEDHRPLMQARGLELDVDAPAAPVVVSGDETRLAQVLGNLLHNAAKFTPARGRVALSVRADAPRAVLQVSDTGSGIAPEVMETLFEPFTQAKQTLARSEGGLGLGLALAKGLVALHGGEIAVSSAGPGRGTTFTVTLPLAAASLASDGRGAGAAPRAARSRVLVVDDNRDGAETLAQLVELLGHDTEVAHDGPSALAAARARTPDVVLCDIGLPGMDGFEVAQRLRSLVPARVRIVALSGYAQPEDVARAMAAGFDAHVAKPPDPDRIAQLLGGGGRGE